MRTLHAISALVAVGTLGACTGTIADDGTGSGSGSGSSSGATATTPLSKLVCARKMALDQYEGDRDHKSGRDKHKVADPPLSLSKQHPEDGHNTAECAKGEVNLKNGKNDGINQHSDRKRVRLCAFCASLEKLQR